MKMILIIIVILAALGGGYKYLNIKNGEELLEIDIHKSGMLESIKEGYETAKEKVSEQLNTTTEEQK